MFVFFLSHQWVFILLRGDCQDTLFDQRLKVELLIWNSLAGQFLLFLLKGKERF